MKLVYPVGLALLAITRSILAEKYAQKCELPPYEYIEPTCEPSKEVKDPEDVWPTPTSPSSPSPSKISTPEKESNCDPNDKCCDTDCGIFGSCDPKNGRCSKCSSSALGVGDVHYISFDGLQTDFQGHCSYQLSGLCDENEVSEATPYFKLIGRQKARGWSQAVTWLHGWKMEWQPSSSSKKMTVQWDLEDKRLKLDSEGLKSPKFYKDLQVLTTGYTSSRSGVVYFAGLLC